MPTAFIATPSFTRTPLLQVGSPWQALAVGVLLVFCCIAATAQSEGVEPLPPRQLPDGSLEFFVRAPQAREAHLAGSFNNWADNQEGRVSGATGRMEGPDVGGLFRITIKLPPGQHPFKYVIDQQNWHPVSHVYMPRARDGADDSLVIIRPDGSLHPAETPFVFPPRGTDRGVEFRVWAPREGSVFLAGTFNHLGALVYQNISDARWRMPLAVDLNAGGNASDFVMFVNDLRPGRYAYMHCLGGRANGWIHGSEELPHDDGGWRSFTLTAEGQVLETLTECLLPPVVADGGVLFRVYAPAEKEMFVLGTFNDWAGHLPDGTPNPRAAMIRYDGGVFALALDVPAGAHEFRYRSGPPANAWRTLTSAVLPLEGSNSVFNVESDGMVRETAGRDPWGENKLDELVARRGAMPPPVVTLFLLSGRGPSADVAQWLTDAASQPVRLRASRIDRRTPEEFASWNAQERLDFQLTRVPAAIVRWPAKNTYEAVIYDGNLERFFSKLEAQVMRQQ